jgi:Tol biopolymer transport system component
VESGNSASRLQVRSLADGSLKSYAGTDFATNPFWSPDGRSLGFFADGKLKRIDLVSGLTQTIAPAPIGGGGTWNRDGIVIFAPTILGGLFKVPAEGGQPVAVTTRSNKDSGHRSPQFLPDGRRFIYFAGGDADVRGLYLASLDGSPPAKRVVEADGVATLMGSDRVLFARQGVLFAQHLDADRGELTGAPVAIANNVAFDPTTYVAAVTATPGGALAYRSGAATGQRQLAWFDRAGRKTDRLGDADPSGLFNPDISPDGRFVAVNRAVDNEDVWLIDTTRGTRRRFTFDPGNDQVPVWSADGQHIVFSSNRGGDSYDLYEKPAERPGAEQLLFTSKENKFPMGVSRDGRYLLYRNTAPNTDWDLWALPLLGEKKPFPVVKSAFQEMIGEFSPDGGWVAYQTNESGQHEVYVQSFPDPTTRTQISTAGGAQPRWRRDGKELFFVALDGRLMAAPLTLNANHLLEAGAPVPLFMTHMPGGAVPSPQKQQYAVSPDGQRFLLNIVLDDAGSSAVSLILNWRPPATK